MKYYERKENFNGNTRYMAKKSDFLKSFIPSIILPIIFYIYRTNVEVADPTQGYVIWFKSLTIGNIVFCIAYLISWLRYKNDNKYFAIGFLTSAILCLLPMVAILIAILFMFY